MKGANWKVELKSARIRRQRIKTLTEPQHIKDLPAIDRELKEAQIGNGILVSMKNTASRQKAPVAGALLYRWGKGKAATLAMLQAFVPNQGSAWELFIRELEDDCVKPAPSSCAIVGAVVH